MGLQFLVAMAATTSHVVVAEQREANRKPHILMLIVDDLGWNNVGWHNKDMLTPHMDQLVAEGLELDRHYTYYYCSPTRSSILSGRLPYHVNQIILSNDGSVPDWGIPKEMTTLPQKLKAAGYATHAAGKWHVGFHTESLLPTNRGFDSYLGYLGGSMDHWTQAQDGWDCPAGICPMQPNIGADLPNQWMKDAGLGGNVIDWWCDNKPCEGKNGSAFVMGSNGQVVGDAMAYTDKQITDRVVSTIHAHNPEVPMFYYVAFQSCHAPLEAPDAFVEMYPAEWRDDRRWYAAMISYVDAAVGNITAALRAKGMWDNTLLVMTSDNGGPTYWQAPPDWPPLVEGAKIGYQHGGAANNWPLKGSKASNWEGGVRVAAFVSGGFLPPRQRGSKSDGYIHCADWYATFCQLAGADPFDNHTIGHRLTTGEAFDLPPVDSINVWSLVSGQESKSPRNELPLSIASPLSSSEALIIGDYKLLLGQVEWPYWQGPAFPNNTAGINAPYGNDLPPYDCGNRTTLSGGCLFNVRKDPHETSDLAQSMPERLDTLKRRYIELRQTHLDQYWLAPYVVECAAGHAHNSTSEPCKKWGDAFINMLKRNKGIMGPFLEDPVNTFV